MKLIVPACENWSNMYADEPSQSSSSECRTGEMEQNFQKMTLDFLSPTLKAQLMPFQKEGILDAIEKRNGW